MLEATMATTIVARSQRTTRWLLRRLAVTVLLGASVASALGAPVSAATVRKLTAADCERINRGYVDAESGILEDDTFGANAGSVADGLKATAQSISDKKVKKAMLGLVAFFEDLAEVDSLADAGKVAQRRARSTGKSFKILTKATLECGGLGTSLNTLPDDLLP